LSTPGAKFTSEVLYRQEVIPTLPTRSDINFRFSPVVSDGQSEKRAAVIYFLGGSWLVYGFDSNEYCICSVYEMAA
jgi:hypothetical protein